MLLQHFKYCPVCGSANFVANSEKSKRCEDCEFEYFMNPSAANVAFIINDNSELLVLRRKNEPAIGTLDLPGGFADTNENAEEGSIREVLEETNLHVNNGKYLFSIPNIYPYSGMDIHTLDMFFMYHVAGYPMVKAMDDASECMWIPINELQSEQFGLTSVRNGVSKFIQGINRYY